MPTDTVPAARGRRLKHFYTPPTHVIDVPGIYTPTDEACDVYKGTKDQLVAAGLLLPGLFPGDPGMPLASVTLWPVGTAGNARWNTPGRLHITKTPSGRFTALLAVDADEQLRRKGVREAKEKERNERYEAERRLRETEKRAGMSLEDIIHALGLPAVREHVNRIERDRKPRRQCAHLRLAWSAPAA